MDKWCNKVKNINVKKEAYNISDGVISLCVLLVQIGNIQVHKFLVCGGSYCAL